MRSASSIHQLRRRRLAAGISVAFAALAALPIPVCASVPPTTWTVNTCADNTVGSDTTGSLRYAVTHAANGDTVQIPAMSCSVISLTTGALSISQSTLIIQGPGMSGQPSIQGSIYHQGNGTLYLENVSVGHGYGHLTPVGATKGGCIYSKGSVYLDRSKVFDCIAYDSPNSTPQSAAGGGIFAKGDLTLFNSMVYGCHANTYQSTGQFSTAVEVTGGGVFVGGNLSATHSEIALNTAGGVFYLNPIQPPNQASTRGSGGGAFVLGNVSLLSSTIDDNFAAYSAGGISIGGTQGNSTIVSSTISGNSAHGGGGLISYAKNITIDNSTIAFNQGATGTLSAGATLNATYGAVTVTMHSSLIANNTYTYASAVHDLDLSASGTSPTRTVTFTTDSVNGNRNLIRTPGYLGGGTLPPDTMANVCPVLGPLKNSGGTTPTHRLYNGPGFGQGNNVENQGWDQRGSPYARISNGVVDVGAYEVQRNDIIFGATFDGCP